MVCKIQNKLPQQNKQFESEICILLLIRWFVNQQKISFESNCLTHPLIVSKISKVKKLFMGEKYTGTFSYSIL